MGAWTRWDGKFASGNPELSHSLLLFREQDTMRKVLDGMDSFIKADASPSGSSRPSERQMSYTPMHFHSPMPALRHPFNPSTSNRGGYIQQNRFPSPPQMPFRPNTPPRAGFQPFKSSPARHNIPPVCHSHDPSSSYCMSLEPRSPDSAGALTSSDIVWRGQVDQTR